MTEHTDRGGDNEQTERDTSYSPASEQETESRQQNPRSSNAVADADIDSDDVKLLPGTGGPDDSGDIDVDDAELNVPRNPGSARPASPRE